MTSFLTKMSTTDSGKRKNHHEVFHPNIKSNQHPFNLRPVIQRMVLVPPSVQSFQSVCPCDGGCPLCMETPVIQAKLRLGITKDPFEKEADAVASQLMHQPDARIGNSIHTIRQIEADEFNQLSCTERGDSFPESHLLPYPISSSGQPLSKSVRSFFETRFGMSLDNVRVHQGAKAAELSTSFGARAFTFGRNIVFGSGQYVPKTLAGLTLLGHELVHVVQQDAVDSRHQKQSDGVIQRQPMEQTNAPTTMASETGDYQSLPLPLKQLIAGTNLEIGFAQGLVEGLFEGIVFEDVVDLFRGLQEPENKFKFEAGIVVGIPVGIVDGIHSNLVGLYELATLILDKTPTRYKLSLLAGPLGPIIVLNADVVRNLFRLATDTEEELEKYKGIVDKVTSIAELLAAIADYIDTNPQALVKEGKWLGHFVGGIVGKWFRERILHENDYYWKGIAIGDVIGLIALEIALLFIAVEVFIGKALIAAARGASAAARVAANALKGSRFGKSVLKILDDIPELKKLMDATRKTKTVRDRVPEVRGEAPSRPALDPSGEPLIVKPRARPKPPPGEPLIVKPGARPKPPPGEPLIVKPGARPRKPPSIKPEIWKPSQYEKHLEPILESRGYLAKDKLKELGIRYQDIVGLRLVPGEKGQLVVGVEISKYGELFPDFVNPATGGIIDAKWYHTLWTRWGRMLTEKSWYAVPANQTMVKTSLTTQILNYQEIQKRVYLRLQRGGFLSDIPDSPIHLVFPDEQALWLAKFFDDFPGVTWEVIH